MQDMKRRSTVTSESTEDTLTITVTGFEPMVLTLAALSQDIKNAAMIHGLTQKLCDAAAIPRDPRTGYSATIADKHAAVREVFDRITDTVNPSWNKNRDGGNGANDSLLAQALMRLTGKTRPEITAYLSDKPKDAKNALRASPKVADMIATIQREKLATTADTADSMLADLGL